MKVVSTEGIVVKTIPYKENSKILNILSPEYGIIGVISKGCKSLKSPNRTVSNNLSYGTFHLSYKEKGLSTLISGDVKNYFTNIKSDIVKISYLTYLTELASHVYKESENKEVYHLLIDALLKIEDGLDPKIISNILEIKYLEYIGLNINVDECNICSSKNIITFSISKGGFVCEKCKGDESIIDAKVLKMLRLYKYVDISKISTLDISEEVSNKINEILDIYISEYSAISIKSKRFLKNLEN